MPPAQPRFNSANRGLPYTIFGSDNSLRSWVFSNSGDLSSSKFCSTRLFTAVSSSMPDFISDIRFMRIPPQIREGVIVAVSIVMAALFSFWSRPNKRCQNERMYLMVFTNIAFPKHNSAVLRPGAAISRSNKSITHVPNVSGVGNFVVSLISNYRQPSFHTALYGIKPTMAQA